MSGELVPLVLIPRFSTYTGAHSFYTIAMDVTEYAKAIVNVWRGDLAGAGTFLISFEESTDQQNWTVCTGGTAADPGADTEAQYTATITKRWFRAKVAVTGTDPFVTCWAVGFLEMRLS